MKALPLVDPRRHAHQGELIYADRLVAGTGHWLAILVAAALLIWLFGLLVSLLGWAGWTLGWMVRRCGRGFRVRSADDRRNAQ